MVLEMISKECLCQYNPLVQPFVYCKKNLLKLIQKVRFTTTDKWGLLLVRYLS